VVLYRVLEGAAMAAAETAPAMKKGVLECPHMQVRPPVTGWLIKRKSDSAASRFFRQSNRRFFTLDYHSQIFYYSHSDKDKIVSLPTPFRDITGVEAVDVQGSCAEGVEDCSEVGSNAPAIQRSNSRTSMGSSMRIPRMSFSKKAPAEQHGFVLRTTSKSMELVCSSKAEADMWVDAIREAIARVQSGKGEKELSGDETLTPELSTATGSSAGTTPRSSSKDAASRQATPPRAPARAKAASPREAPEAGAAAAGYAPAAAASEKRRAFGLLPPRAPRRPAAPAQTEAASIAAEAEGSGSSWAAAAAEAGAEAEAPAAQAASGSWLAAEPEPAPCEAVGEMISVVEAQKDSSYAREVAESDAAGATPAWGCAPSTEQRYSDKGEGLSLQKRLESMEFSDDDDEDTDSPSRSRGLRFQPSETSVSLQAAPVEEEPRPVASTALVTVEACESFVAPESDDE